MSLNVAPHHIETGEATLAFGRLICSGGSVAGQAVTVVEHPFGSGASTAGTATTNAAGQYELTTPALSVNTSFYATALGARSGEKKVSVSPKVSLVGPPDGSVLYTGRGPILPSSLPKGYRPPPSFRNTVTFTGTVSPADAGALVVLQREQATSGDEWFQIGKTVVGAGGSFTIVHTFAVPGDANIRVVVHPGKFGPSAPGASEPLTYEISQAQNPALTILSSGDPVSYGQPVTISGTVAAASGTALTLMERPRGATHWVAVANTTSTAGTYAFPARAQTRSAYYQVTGAGQTSAKLFEGVRYSISVVAPAATVQAGQPLVFTGTVTPGLAGHAVILSIVNPGGIGLHPVEVGTENATGGFTIMHAQFVAGVKQFRIRVLGDPEFESTSSPLFTVNVTPAPPGALKPELPGNTSLPSEGQL